jgi:tRNA threonylcarbamoyl adenosine modification protein (Sua5/YciO/YrdC/YwlC family)
VDPVAALRAGEPVLLPTDGVYGLCSSIDEHAVRRLYALKGRAGRQPTAIIAASVEALLELLPGLDPALVIPGPFTCVVPNVDRRFPWLAGDRPDTIGVRVPVLPLESRPVLDAVRAVAATSANDPGGPAASSLDEVPERIRAAVAAAVDGGRLAGIASTVVDLTGETPVVLRQGAGELR